MKIRNLALLLVVLVFSFTCVGCDENTTIPHSSNEYENGEWSVNELVEHFEDLGFTDIDVEEYTTFDEHEEAIQVVVAEDSSSWSPSYRDFKKGESVDTSQSIIIRETKLIPILTTENCPEFAEFVKNGTDSPNNTASWSAFLETHNGEALEFDGTITDWYDEFWYVSGVNCTIAIENSEHLSYYWNVDSLDDLGLNHSSYHAGLVTEGMNIHMLTIINYSKDSGLNLEVELMEIIE